jgi:hypothetical protein
MFSRGKDKKSIGNHEISGRTEKKYGEIETVNSYKLIPSSPGGSKEDDDLITN